MKSMAELEAIREETLARISLRRQDPAKNVRIFVGMGTCGIAAGARSVVTAFLKEIEARKLLNVTLAQTDCAGDCSLEPVVEVCLPGQEKVTYVHMTAGKVARVMDEHVLNGQVVAEYTK